MTTFLNNDPVDDDWSQKFGFGNPRATDGLQGICVHTTENNLGAPAEGVANYQINTETGSYHVLVDNTDNDNVNSIRANTDDWLTWSAGWTGNQIAVHISFVARAAMSRADWLGATRMLNEGADVCAYWVKKFNFPITKLSAADLKAGKRGLFGHADVSAAWKEVNHWDPGANFPWDVFLDMIKLRINAPAPKPDTESKETAIMNNEQSQKLNRVNHELTHEFQSRYIDADNNRSRFRDTAIGYALENDAKLTRLTDQILPRVEAKLDTIIQQLTK